MTFTKWPTIGDDRIEAGNDNDTLTGFWGNDQISAGMGDDLVFEGYVTWTGLSERPFVAYETYDFGLGRDTLDGGYGLDLLSYEGRRVGLTLNLRKGVMTSGGERDVLKGFERYVLTERGDLAISNANALAFDMGSGNDTLRAGRNLVYATGGAGVDSVNLSVIERSLKVDLYANKSITGLWLTEFEHVKGASAYSNVILGNEEANHLSGGKAVDTLSGSWGRDTLIGGAGEDSLYGAEDEDVLYGGYGNDTLSGGDGNDLLINEGGQDRIFGGDGRDTIFGGEQGDRITDFGTYRNQAETFEGRGGNDTIEAGGYGARVYGGDGADVLKSYGYSLRLFGGDGDDVLKISQTSSNPVLSGGSGNDTFFAANVAEEGIFKGEDGDDIFRGAVSRIYGGNGNDTIRIIGEDVGHIVSASLGAGNDTVYAPRVGAETLLAGQGNDVIYMGGAIIAHGEGGDDRIELIDEGHVYGGDGNDVLLVAAGEVDGGAGNDRISIKHWAYEKPVFGGAGDDIVELDDNSGLERLVWGAIGGAGNDKLIVHAGDILVSDQPIYNDVSGRLISVSGFEELVFTSPEARVRYVRHDSQMVFGETSDVLVIRTANKLYDLGGGNDDVDVFASNVTLMGGAGNDQISTGGNAAGDMGDHVVWAGTGDDTLLLYGYGTAYGGDGDDNATVMANFTYDAAEGNDIAQLGLVKGMRVGSGPWTFTEESGDMSNTVCTMGSGNDRVNVFGHIKSLDMGDGDDIVSITQATHEDWEMWGGTGADCFQFKFEGSFAQVTILDFEVAVDVLAMERVYRKSDIDQIVTYARGTKIVEGNWIVLLEGVTVAEITDAIIV